MRYSLALPGSVFGPIIPDQEQIGYKTILNVQLPYANQSLELVKVFKDVFAAKTNVFDLEKALQVAKSHKSIGVINTTTQKIDGSKTQLYVVVEQLQNLIKMATGVATGNPEMFGMAAMAFMNLNKQKNGSWFTVFNESSEKINYQYNLFQVIQNKETGAVLSGTLSSMRIDISKASANVLNLVGGDSMTYSVDYKAITMVEALQKA
ncbi:MAG: type-2Aa cytolytic delta-endotoxin [Spirochaetota bacterium]